MNKNSADTRVRSTTVLLVRRNGEVAMAGDGQVTLGETVIKGKARKVRRLGGSGEILAGFAGSGAAAFSTGAGVGSTLGSAFGATAACGGDATI